MIVVIGLPSQEQMWTFTSVDMAATKAFMEVNGVNCPIINQQMARLEQARNNIVQMAREVDIMNEYGEVEKRRADYILWIDSDMRFPRDVFFKLHAHQKNIVGCNAMQRKEGGRLAITKDRLGRNLTPKDFSKGGLRQMEFIGMAVTLVNMDVYDAIEPPWYYAVYTEKGFTGEDKNFCKEAIDAGYHVWCDMELSKAIGHVGQKVFKI